MNLEYITLGFYFLILLGLGVGFSRVTKNMSDFVRGGAQGTWWLVGSSIVMAGISAFTFTGNGSAAFMAGPTFLIIYVANCAAYLIGWLFLAAWFRQTRAYTQSDLLRARFGTAVEQFASYTGLFLGPLASAIQLWALAMFSSAVFGFPMTPTIVVIGVVVVVYSTLGGRWAVMATDFVQGVIMMAITTAVAILALQHIGGVGAFLNYFSHPEFVEDFKLINDPGQFDNDRFTLKWVVVIFFMTLYHQISLVTATRYLAVKDGREARRASLFAFFLMAIGSAIWFLPPMVARFMYGDEIMAQGLENPAESAYAFIAMKLLPNGLLGVLIAAMFAATMSSMDTGLNTQAGIVVRNIVPRLRSALGLNPEISNRYEMWICYLSTLCFGCIIIGGAILFSQQKEFILFDAYFIIGSVIGIPLGFPLVVGLWVKRIPFWSYFVIFGACLIPSFLSFYDAQFNNNPWTIQDRALWIFVAGIIATVGCFPLWKFAGKKQCEQISEFFTTMKTPVDFAAEIGLSTDKKQAKIIGISTSILGAAILLLLLLPNTMVERLWILSVGGTVATVGIYLSLYGSRGEKW
jgi:solute:Na+ symporter, SSS family